MGCPRVHPDNRALTAQHRRINCEVTCVVKGSHGPERVKSGELPETAEITRLGT